MSSPPTRRPHARHAGRSSWLPADFRHPTRVEVPFGHHLRPIRAEDTDLDMVAVMGSRERLWSIYGEAWGWPPADMTHEADRPTWPATRRRWRRTSRSTTRSSTPTRRRCWAASTSTRRRSRAPTRRSRGGWSTSAWAPSSRRRSTSSSRAGSPTDWPLERPRYVGRDLTLGRVAGAAELAALNPRSLHLYSAVLRASTGSRRTVEDMSDGQTPQHGGPTAPAARRRQPVPARLLRVDRRDSHPTQPVQPTYPGHPGSRSSSPPTRRPASARGGAGRVWPPPSSPPPCWSAAVPASAVPPGGTPPRTGRAARRRRARCRRRRCRRSRRPPRPTAPWSRWPRRCCPASSRSTSPRPRGARRAPASSSPPTARS